MVATDFLDLVSFAAFGCNGGRGGCSGVVRKTFKRKKCMHVHCVTFWPQSSTWWMSMASAFLPFVHRQPNKIMAHLNFHKWLVSVCNIHNDIWMVQTKTSHLGNVSYAIISLGWRHVSDDSISVAPKSHRWCMIQKVAYPVVTTLYIATLFLILILFLKMNRKGTHRIVCYFGKNDQTDHKSTYPFFTNF